MQEVWLIEFTAERPPVYIADGGGLTYQAKKAKRYATKEEAKARLDELKLADRWEAVQHVLSGDSRVS